MRLFDGFSGFVEQAALNFEAVTRPALCSNQTLLLDWPLVDSSMFSASSALSVSSSNAFFDFWSNSRKSFSKFSSLNSSVRGFDRDLISGTNAALWGAISERIAVLIPHLEMSSKKWACSSSDVFGTFALVRSGVAYACSPKGGRIHLTKWEVRNFLHIWRHKPFAFFLRTRNWIPHSNSCFNSKKKSPYIWEGLAKSCHAIIVRHAHVSVLFSKEPCLQWGFSGSLRVIYVLRAFPVPATGLLSIVLTQPEMKKLYVSIDLYVFICCPVILEVWSTR